MYTDFSKKSMGLGALLDDSCSYDEWQLFFLQSFVNIANTFTHSKIFSYSPTYTCTFAQYVSHLDHLTTLNFQGYIRVNVILFLRVYLLISSIRILVHLCQQVCLDLEKDIAAKLFNRFCRDL